MKGLIVVLLVVSIFCSPLVSSVYAGQITPQEITQEEGVKMQTMDADSSGSIVLVKAGGSDGLAIIGGVFVVLVCLSAIAGA